MTPAVSVEHLTKRFGGTVALDDVSFEVARGELFGLVGPDGAGKTTALRVLASVMAPDAGTVRVAGCDVRADAEGVKRRIGYMSQRFGLYHDLTVAENANFYADIYGVTGPERTARIRRLLDWSGLEEFRSRLAGRLSGGMRQKLGLVCALVHTPEVLLLDEPTNGVDPVARRELWRILGELVAQGVTAVVSTSYLDEAERFARVGVVHRGRLVALDEPRRVRRMVPGSVVELPIADARRHARELREIFGFDAVGLFGDRVHVLVPGDDPLDRVRRALGLRGLDSRGARVVESSLEDVFVSVLGGRDDG